MKAFFENRTYEDGFRVDVWHGRDMHFLAHWHRELELVFVCEGEIRIGINHEIKIMKKGDLCIIDSSDIHFYDSKDLHSYIIIVIFNPAFIGFRAAGLSHQHFLNPYIEHSFLKSIEPGFPEKIRDLFISITREYDNESPYYDMYIKSNLLALWTLFHRHFPTIPANIDKRPDHLPYVKAIKASISFLENNYSNPVTLESLSGHVNLSPFYFSRLFKKISGMNFKEYLDNLRVEKAENMIKDRSGTISQIALDCGFNSIRTFNRVFKAVKGYPPSKAR